MRIALVLMSVSPEYDSTTLNTFDDTVKVLTYYLEALGHDLFVTSNLWPEADKIIVLNACVSPYVPNFPGLPRGVILYNLESWNSVFAAVYPAMADAVKELGATIWDLRQENVANWKASFGVEVKHVPFGYAPTLAPVTYRSVEKYTDVLFYGSVTERRRDILSELQKHCNVRICHNLYSPERERVMSTSKVVLALRAEEGYQTEPIRIITALANGCFVVAEDGEWLRPFDGGLIACGYDWLIRTCLSALEWSEKDRNTIAAAGQKLAKQTTVKIDRELLIC